MDYASVAAAVTRLERRLGQEKALAGAILQLEPELMEANR